MSKTQQLPPVKSYHRTDHVLRMERDANVAVALEDLPPTLWLKISNHSEWAIGWQHAWGTAHVSTREDGSDSFAVPTVGLSISVGNRVVAQEEQHGAADCSADWKNGGMVVGDFSSHWEAWAEHPGYGRWTASASL